MAATARSRRSAPDRDQLADELADRLLDPRDDVQPIVLSHKIGRSGKWSVTVIWDRWSGLSMQDRTEIIYLANEKRQEPADIAIATGLAIDEAINLGYLPYQIQTARMRTDQVTLAELRKAMIAEGALPTSTGPQLRYVTEEAAVVAYRRLQTRLPGPYWMIVKEVFRDS